MTKDVHDPRISKILLLVSQLIDRYRTVRGEAHDEIGDDIDRTVDAIAAGLNAIVEELEGSIASRHHLNDILQSMFDSLIVTDLDDNITMVNEAACHLLDCQEGELLGQPINDLFVEQYKGNATGVYGLEEWMIVTKDDRHIPVSCSRSQLRNNQGQPEGFIYVAQDITERKHVENALRQGEARYRALLESQVDLISCYRPDTILTFVNDAYCQFYGKTREELIGQSYLIMVAPEFHEQTIKETENMAKDPTPFSGEYLNYAADGRACWIQWVIQGIVDENGQVVELQGVGRDVTRLKQTEAALRLSNFAVERVSDAVYWVDEDAKITDVNEAACRMLGYSREEFNGMSVAAIDPTKTLDEVKALWKQTQKEESLAFETEHKTKAGHIFPVEIVASYISYEGKDFSCCFVRDITERKQAEEEIRQLNEELEQRVIERTKELEEANEEIRHFAYIVSHDLRAPLINLKGFAAELRADLNIVEEGCSKVLPLVEQTQRDKMVAALQEDIPEALRFIESSVSNMDTFTKAILKLSRLGRLHLELVEVDVKSLVEQMLQTLTYQIDQLGITVTVGDLPAVTADLVSMEQIFGNILINAITYLDPDRPGEIEVRGEYRANEAVYSVRDNGRGITQEDMDKVFAPFRRAGKQDMPGEGMGLAYVQVLVRRHGGRIWCESEPGGGTTFTFTISRKLANDSIVL